MTAYWVARAKINDSIEYKKYTDIAGPALIAAGAKILSRGGKIINLEGKEMNRLVVIEFPSCLLYTSPSPRDQRG